MISATKKISTYILKHKITIALIVLVAHITVLFPFTGIILGIGLAVDWIEGKMGDQSDQNPFRV